MIEFFLDNWAVIVPAVAGLIALFFPQLKPLVDLLVKHKPTPAPVPIVDGDKPSDLLGVVQSIQHVIDHFQARGNADGEALARQVAQSLFAELPTDKPTTRAKAK